MSAQLKHISSLTTQALGIMILLTLLVACGATSGGSTSTAPPTPTHTPPASTATPTSTPTSPSPTSSSTTGATSTLAGNGYTMSYPQNWQLSRSSALLAVLTDSTGSMKLAVTVTPDPNGSITADSVANAALKVAVVPLKNVQPESVPPTVTVAGNTWSQKSASGTRRANLANTVIQNVAIATVHPGNTLRSKSYTIVYNAPKNTFDQANATYFQPMLQSFKFLS